MFSSQAISLELPIMLDRYSLSFIFSVRLISASVYLFSRIYIMNEVFSVRFHLLVIAFVKSMILLIVSPNIFSVILG
jgi:NADH:ubiquinone oxidoreductase subunit 5 (subunit L)/multisubunit Na+/H+ antiporter MnhA subunit